MSGTLHVFQPGESALVAENLDSNFQLLLSLINAAGSQLTGHATGTSTASAIGRTNLVSVGASAGLATVLGQSAPLAIRQGVAAATGVSTTNFIASTQTGSVAAATGTGNVVGISTNSSVAAATGTSSTSFVGLGTVGRIGAATGTSTATGISIINAGSQAVSVGASTAHGTGQGGASESTDPTAVTQPTQIIFGSATPGQASTTLNTFTLPANPGGVFFNNIADTNTSVNTGIVEIYYTGHVVFAQTQSNTWFRWVSANNWSPTASPLAAFVAESVDGAIVTAASQTIFGSSTPGVAAPPGATVGNGLETWTLSANPGFVVRNGINQDGTGGTTITQNVVELYYKNHRVYQENTDPNWWFWDPTVTGSWNGPGATPVPTTPTISIGAIPSRINVNETFVTSGSYQDFTGTGNPVLQYADNIAQGTTSSFNPADGSASIVLSNSNQTATASIASRAGVRSTTSRASGKFMFECTMGTVATNLGFGLADASFQFTTNIGDDTNAIGFRPNWSNGTQAVVFNGATLTSTVGQTDINGDKITVCVDVTNDVFWVTSNRMRTAGNTWNNSPSANPATNTGGISFSLATGPYFICFSDGDATGAITLNTAGPFAVSIPAGFLAWDATAATTWQSLPAGATVTPTSFSFVHPPMTTLNFAATVSVRDAVATGVVGQSNNFQVATAGVVTLFPMTLSNTTFQANAAAGTVVGTLTIPASGGTFSGTVNSNDAKFSVAGATGSRTLQTTQVVGPGTFPVTLTAIMANAVNSGETLAVSLSAGAESPQATDVTTTGVNIVGSSTPGSAGAQLTWALGAGNRITLGGVVQNAFTNITELYYINHKLYMKINSAPVAWSVYNGAAASGGQLAVGAFTSTIDPHPIVVLNKTSFAPLTNGDTLIRATLISASDTLPSVTWTDDSASFVFSGNVLNTTGALPAGTYPVNITGTIPA